MIHYHVAAHNIRRHLFRVRLCFYNENKESVRIFLPNWTAGSYLIRDFCKNVISMRASCDNLSQVLRQINKNTWEIPPIAGEWVIEYEVYAFDLSVRTVFLDEDRLFFDGAALLMTVAGREHEPCVLHCDFPEDWRAATALPQAADRAYHAEDYAALIDAPLTAGHLHQIEFSVAGIPHQIVLTGEYAHLDENKLRDDVARICAQQLALFGHAPFARYVFLLHVADNAYGGLEHRASSALLAARRCLPSTRREDNREDYITLLGLFSHEYFHAWNVKAIKPAVFQPYDLQKEVYTEQLWAFEGITSYYDDLMLVRAGVVSPQEYLQLLVKNIDTVHQGQGRFVQSLAQSSFNAWTKFYQQNENSPNAIVSYYQKGALAALCLDVLIRLASGGGKSLDDVMRLLYARVREDGKGLADEAWQRAAEEVAGKDLSDFFRQAVYGTDDLPLVQALADLGLVLRFCNADQHQVVVEFPEQRALTPEFGAKLEDVPGGKRVLRIAHGTQAECAGLAVGDVIVAINRCGASEFDAVWRQVRAGDEVTVHYLRQNRLRENCFTATAVYPQRAMLKIADQGKLDHWLAALA